MDNNQQNSDNGSSKVDQLKNNIQQQLHAGLTPNEISQHLKTAGWSEEDINSAFKAVQGQVVPNTGVVSGGPAAQVPNDPKRGRIKTGWLLFKQSIKVLRSDKMLVRYVIMSLLVSIVAAIIYAVVLIAGRHTFITKTVSGNTTNFSLAPAGYLPTFVFYILEFFVVNLYGAALAANVLDLFHGTKQPYNVYIKKAWSKAGTLFVFSVIEATVGLILRAIAERSKILGRIIVWIIGAAWSLARIFVVPIIVSSDENAFQAVKESTQLLVATWGENIVGRVSLGGVIFLIELALIPIFIILFVILGSVAGGVGIFIGAVIFIITVLVFSIVTSAASSVLNTALFYYAKNKQVPAAFDPGLLSSVFIHKKQRGNKNTPVS